MVHARYRWRDNLWRVRPSLAGRRRSPVFAGRSCGDGQTIRSRGEAEKSRRRFRAHHRALRANGGDGWVRRRQGRRCALLRPAKLESAKKLRAGINQASRAGVRVEAISGEADDQLKKETAELCLRWLESRRSGT